MEEVLFDDKVYFKPGDCVKLKQSEKMLNNNDNSSLDLNNEQYFCNNRS